MALRFDVSLVVDGLLVDSSRRQSSSLFSLPSSLPLLALVSTLRSGAHLQWPGWWTSASVANHEKPFCLYFHRNLSLGCAVRVKLVPLQGIVRRSGSKSQACVWFGFPSIPVSTCFPSGCLVWLCSRLFLGHRKSHPKSRTAPNRSERSQDWK